eukprot:CAMPEP_0184328150 /NCGR_PEP_ID=MMETSP1049-20130417/143470_1 /TAXON_ID=77928 /ORGANISM="Proteomonas sulcata, Strain CCMP704" /LENGTH=93 /DNA_ID=CAMNT_0026650445 /DNA_START=416 /DNA_END=697 /DNA_ORIENTATION=-
MRVRRFADKPTLTSQMETAKDVPLKDIPGWAGKIQSDPKTAEAAQGFFGKYHLNFVKAGSDMPVYHTIFFMWCCGYAVDYMAHLRHEKNYKYH